MSTSAKITYLYSHGIADDKNQAFKYTSSAPNPIIDNQDHTLVTFDYPDAGQGIIYPVINNWIDLLNLKENLKKISYKIDRAHTSFAQDNEIAVLNDAHALIETEAIGIGVSRGASAFMTWLGTYPDIINIKALVLESPFDCMDSVLRNMIGEYLYQYPAARSIGHNLIRFVFSQYKKHGITPLKVVDNIPKNLPILIICSEEDSRVPARSSENLANALREAGLTNVHCVRLSHGFHGHLIQGPDGQIYRNAVHAFYKRYDLPHNSEWAELGKSLI